MEGHYSVKDVYNIVKRNKKRQDNSSENHAVLQDILKRIIDASERCESSLRLPDYKVSRWVLKELRKKFTVTLMMSGLVTPENRETVSAATGLYITW